MVQIQSNKWIRGLNLNSNPYVYTAGKDPYGATSNATVIADETVLWRNRMIGNRKGFDYFTKNTSANVMAFFEFQQNLVEHQSDNTLWYSDLTTGTRTQLTGTFIPPSPYRMDGTVSRGSLYLTSTAGVLKMEAYNATPMVAGLTKGLDLRATTSGTGNGFMTGFSKCAYRVTWRRTDVNNQLIRSDVSPAVVVTNNSRITVSTLTQASGTATCTTIGNHGFVNGDTIVIAGATQVGYNGSFVIAGASGATFTYTVPGGTATPATGSITAEKYLNATITFTVPWDLPSGTYYEVWRTVTKDGSYTDPGDDMFLVTSALVTTGGGTTITVTDIAPDSVIQGNAALYTNAGQEGALQGNSRPPLACCLTNFKDYAIYGNTAIDYQLNNVMLSTVNFVANTSSIKIIDISGTRTYTAQAAENTATNSWQLYTGGVSPSFNIERSTRSLCHVINCDASGRWYAEYISGATSTPGMFRIWARSPLSGAFWLNVDSTTTGNQFNPVLPTSGQGIIASNDYRPNRLFYSKFQQPSAVPILNTIDVGRMDAPILRVIAARDNCYVIKTDGVWYLSGLSAPFSVVELDSTCHCVAPATVAMLNNNVLFLANQGIVQVSLSGITVVSVDIEPLVMRDTLRLSNLAATAFAVAQESSRQYLIWLPVNTGDTYGKIAMVYHTFSQEWTMWRRPAYSAASVQANFTLYLSAGLEKAVLKQRMAGDVSDYSDEELAITVMSQSNLTIQLHWLSTVYPPTAGLTVHQGASLAKVIAVQALTGDQWIFTLDRVTTFTPGAATSRLPIYSHVRLSPNTLGEAGMIKSIYAVSFLPEANTVTQVQMELATNEAPQLRSFPIKRSISLGWGTSAWGSTAYGDDVSLVKVIPFELAMPIPDVTGETVTAGWIHSVSQEPYCLAQCAVLFDQLAELEFVA